MPTADEPTARLTGLTVAEVAEALEAPPHQQLRHRIGDDVLVVYSLTADQRAVGVLLARQDDSLVWRVTGAKPLSAAEFETWLGRIQP
jgi:hypothetical protein